jgi:aminoglycoside phosphotransferase
MNRAYKFFDVEYMLALFRRKLPALYPNLASVESLVIIPHKKHIWESTYHVVAEYQLEMKERDGHNMTLLVFCSAHDSEPRRNVYEILHYLRSHGFGDEEAIVPQPLFFSEYLNGVFYRGINGHNLHHFIQQQDQKEMKSLIPKAARWFARLHALPADDAHNFNEDNSRIRTVIPGVDEVLAKVSGAYPQYADFYKAAYGQFISQEESFLAGTPRLWLIHGDAHPENIIKLEDGQLGVIDFGDFSLSDFARDLGCFTQQLWYMMTKAGWKEAAIKSTQKSFLDEYARASGCHYDAGLQARIDNYYHWTFVRTITYLLLSGVVNRNAEKLAHIDNLITSARGQMGL